MKVIFQTQYKYTKKTIALILAISFAYSMLFAQTAKAESISIFADIFQVITDTLNPEKAEAVIAPELPMQEWVLQQVAEAGLNPDEAEIIITCESRWDPDAMGVNYNRTADLGLWQINSIHKDISNSDKLDYKKATDWAIEKRLKDGHWRAWACARKLARR